MHGDISPAELDLCGNAYVGVNAATEVDVLGGISAERFLDLPIIKLKPVTLVHTSRSAILCCVRWSGHRLACPVGLLGGRCECRSFAGKDA